MEVLKMKFWLCDVDEREKHNVSIFVSPEHKFIYW